LFLDISKAIDKVNSYSLFGKLMNRDTRFEFINVLVIIGTVVVSTV